MKVALILLALCAVVLADYPAAKPPTHYGPPPAPSYGPPPKATYGYGHHTHYGHGKGKGKGFGIDIGSLFKAKAAAIKSVKDSILSGIGYVKGSLLALKGRLLRTKGNIIASKGQSLIDLGHYLGAGSKGKGKGKGYAVHVPIYEHHPVYPKAPKAPKATYGVPAPKPTYGAPHPAPTVPSPGYGAPKPEDVVHVAPSSGYAVPVPSEPLPVVPVETPSSSYGAPAGGHSSDGGSRPIPVPVPIPVAPLELIVPRPPSPVYGAPGPVLPPPSPSYGPPVAPGGSGAYVPDTNSSYVSYSTSTAPPPPALTTTHTHHHHTCTGSYCTPPQPSSSASPAVGGGYSYVPPLPLSTTESSYVGLCSHPPCVYPTQPSTSPPPSYSPPPPTTPTPLITTESSYVGLCSHPPCVYPTQLSTSPPPSYSPPPPTSPTPLITTTESSYAFICSDSSCTLSTPSHTASTTHSHSHGTGYSYNSPTPHPLLTPRPPPGPFGAHGGSSGVFRPQPDQVPHTHVTITHTYGTSDSKEELGPHHQTQGPTLLYPASHDYPQYPVVYPVYGVPQVPANTPLFFPVDQTFSYHVPPVQDSNTRPPFIPSPPLYPLFNCTNHTHTGPDSATPPPTPPPPPPSITSGQIPSFQPTSPPAPVTDIFFVTESDTVTADTTDEVGLPTTTELFPFDYYYDGNVTDIDEGDIRLISPGLPNAPLTLQSFRNGEGFRDAFSLGGENAEGIFAPLAQGSFQRSTVTHDSKEHDIGWRVSDWHHAAVGNARNAPSNFVATLPSFEHSPFLPPPDGLPVETIVGKPIAPFVQPVPLHNDLDFSQGPASLRQAGELTRNFPLPISGDTNHASPSSSVKRAAHFDAQDSLESPPALGDHSSVSDTFLEAESPALFGSATLSASVTVSDNDDEIDDNDDDITVNDSVPKYPNLVKNFVLLRNSTNFMGMSPTLERRLRQPFASLNQSSSGSGSHHTQNSLSGTPEQSKEEPPANTNEPTVPTQPQTTSTLTRNRTPVLGLQSPGTNRIQTSEPSSINPNSLEPLPEPIQPHPNENLQPLPEEDIETLPYENPDNLEPLPEPNPRGLTANLNVPLSSEDDNLPSNYEILEILESSSF